MPAAARPPRPRTAPKRGRYAPSPTGDLHLGNARTALLAWLAARATGGTFVLRVEDLDRARVVPGAEARQLADLRWLGLDWDEGPDCGGPFGPYRQSERLALYEDALERLRKAGRAFPCVCSRADVARAASAPHTDEEGPRYPGTCRARTAAAAGQRTSWRFRAEPEDLVFDDEVQGPHEVSPPASVDDFVLRRADGIFAYQLAVVVDDRAMRIGEVVRAADLLSSTPRQLALSRALSSDGQPDEPPAFAHVPLVLGPQGERLAKRARPVTLRDLTDARLDPRTVVGVLAASAGLLDTPQPVRPVDLIAEFSWSRVRREPVIITWQSAELAFTL